MLMVSNVYTQEQELCSMKRILSSLQIIVFTPITEIVSHFNSCRSGVSYEPDSDVTQHFGIKKYLG
jgi:hypothetical protein